MSFLMQKFPMPGIEPGPAGWKPAILATRPHGKVRNNWVLGCTYWKPHSLLLREELYTGLLKLQFAVFRTLLDSSRSLRTDLQREVAEGN